MLTSISVTDRNFGAKKKSMGKSKTIARGKRLKGVTTRKKKKFVENPSKEKKKVKTSQIRKPSAQTKFRKKSGSRKKDEKQAAHIFDLELATHILQSSKGQKPCEKLKEILNDKSNFRLVKTKTNLSGHREIVQSLIDKSKDPKNVLNAKEEKRAKEQVKFLYSKKTVLPEGFKTACAQFYKSLHTKEGVTLLNLNKF